MTQRVLVDANILYQKTAMDWVFLLRQKNQGMFQLFATEDILAEVVANMRKNRPMVAGCVTSRRAELIRKNLDEVLRDYPGGGLPSRVMTWGTTMCMLLPCTAGRTLS